MALLSYDYNGSDIFDTDALCVYYVLLFLDKLVSCNIESLCSVNLHVFTLIFAVLRLVETWQSNRCTSINVGNNIAARE